MRSLAARLFAGLLPLAFAFVACGPPPKPTAHPARDSFGGDCPTEDGGCPGKLECMHYKDGSKLCEKRCNYDEDCMVGASCTAVPGAMAPVCRASGDAPAASSSG